MQGMHTEVAVQHTRNEKGRLRIGKIDVKITPDIPEPDPQKLRRCLDLFEDFCVVTQSVRNGIDVSVTVQPPA
jgi:organic hydroperoxide reductase OsmC/OhrA